MARVLLIGLAAGSMVAGLGLAAPRAEAPAVVASIKPVHALVAGVTAGVDEPTLLVQGAASPHTYTMRPSDARALQQATLVFWIGDGLETFLEQPLEALAGDARVIELGATPGLTLLPTRAGGTWGEHEHGDEERDAAQVASEPHDEHAEEGGEHAHEEEHHAHEAGSDMHIWLDPHNALFMVERIVAALSETDPDRAATYERNGGRLQARIEQLDAALEQKLAPVSDRPFVVFHDAYHYFEHRYGLNAVGSITVSPERPPGARRLREIQDALAGLGAACVFAEPQFEPALVATVVEGTGAGTGVLDPEGASYDEGPELYFDLLHGLADSLIACLNEG